MACLCAWQLSWDEYRYLWHERVCRNDTAILSNVRTLLMCNNLACVGHRNWPHASALDDHSQTNTLLQHDIHRNTVARGTSGLQTSIEGIGATRMYLQVHSRCPVCRGTQDTCRGCHQVDGPIPATQPGHMCASWTQHSKGVASSVQDDCCRYLAAGISLPCTQIPVFLSPAAPPRMAYASTRAPNLIAADTHHHALYLTD
jgi:hypothetical protein